MNEEDVKNKVIVPWLTARGVPEHDLSFERHFRVKLGRHTAVVGDSAEGSVITGRLDILVARHARNLLVVEVKTENVDLTDDDRDQGISYARLVHPVAPFVLVTNGREYRLYDTLTKNLISDSTVISRDFTIALPDEDRIDALKLFLASSPANVLRLSSAQIDGETATLKGNPNDLGAVYIPAAHRPQTDLLTAVHRFLKSSSALFVILGEAGSGKTCAAVDIANSLVEHGYPAFFYQSGMIESNVLDAVWSEIAWTFDEQSDRVRALRHLSNQGVGKPFVVVLDALDEWTHVERAKHFRWLAQHIDAAHTRIVATCKDAAWSEFLALRGQQTGIDRYVFAAKPEKRYSEWLGPLSHKHFHELLSRYRVAFGVSGGVDHSAQEAGRSSPFLLRVMFQVAAATAKQDITLYSSDLFRHYLELAVSRTKSADVSRNIVRIVAGLMFDRDTDWLGEEDVRMALQLRPTEELPRDLFTNRILNISGPAGSRRITFTFAQLRSYVIAFVARKWEQMDASRFETEIAEADGLVRSEAVALYYSVASRPHQEVLEGPIRQNASAYLQHYERVIGHHFPALKEAFLPFTKGSIGIGATLRVRRRRVEMFGFRPRSGDEPAVLIVPSEASDDRSVLFRLGIKIGHGGAPADAFTAGNVEKYVLINEIVRQLKEIVEDMMLVEAPAVAQEAVVSGLKQHAEKFAKLMEGGKRPEPAYPVSLSAIRAEYRRDALRADFREDILKAKRARGEIQETWNGSIVSFSPNFTQHEHAEIERRVELGMEGSLSPTSKVTLVNGVRLWRRMSRSLEELEAGGATHIDVPFSFKNVERQSADLAQSLAFRHYCKELFGVVLASYSLMVETNFPTLRQHFRVYGASPCCLVLAMPKSQDQWGSLYFCGGVTRNQIEVFSADDVVDPTRGTRTEIETPLGRRKWFLSQSVTQSDLIDGPGMSRTGKVKSEGVVRRWVYSWLGREIDSALIALLASAGISERAAVDAGLRSS